MNLLLHWKSFRRHEMQGAVQGDHDSIFQVYHKIVCPIRQDLDVLKLWVIDQHGISQCDRGSPCLWFKPLDELEPKVVSHV